MAEFQKYFGEIHSMVRQTVRKFVERLYREIRALRIYEGTSEIQKLIIANTYMNDLTILTADQKILSYPHIKALW